MSISKKDLRNFSFIWAIVFAVVALTPYIKGRETRYWALCVAAVFIFSGVLFPVVLKPFYRIWIKFGDFVGKINSKIILFILFYCLFVPVGLFLKLLGKDMLQKNISKHSVTYWSDRSIQPGTMKNQF